MVEERGVAALRLNAAAHAAVSFEHVSIFLAYQGQFNPC
jgi:hypothetical protein